MIMPLGLEDRKRETNEQCLKDVVGLYGRLEESREYFGKENYIG
jgi:hypothetical protein